MDLEDQLHLGHLLLSERVCRVCGEEKNLIDGYYRTRKNNTLASSYAYECKKCTIKRITNKRKKGVGFKEYNRRLVEQNNQCAICKTLQAGGKYNSFMVDRNNVTGDVRGLLCKNCNNALKYVGDNLHTLQSMIEYLQVYE